MQKKQKQVIVIAGPTAVGKTALGIEVAKRFDTEIISADSRQCFKELAIGVARPSEEELAQVPHHFIATHSIHEKVTAATFEDYALAKANEIFRHKNIVVVVGGTGLYIKAFLEGMDSIPDIPDEVHNEVISAYQQNGMEWLQEEIQKSDPLYWQQGETKNPQRMMRALEVVKTTSQSILHFQRGEKKNRDFSIVKIALDLPREELYRNINHRVDKMMEARLLEEVRSLQAYKHLNALQTVGYKEMFQYLDGELSLSQATEAIKQHTRQYAKRQLTWFRKDKEFIWQPPDAQAVITTLEAQQPQA